MSDELVIDITHDEAELVHLFRDLNEEEQQHVLGLLRAIYNSRTAPAPPTLDEFETS